MGKSNGKENGNRKGCGKKRRVEIYSNGFEDIKYQLYLKLRELVRLSRVRERERGERLGCLLTRSQALLAVAVLSSSGDRQLWGLGDSSLSLSLSLSL